MLKIAINGSGGSGKDTFIDYVTTVAAEEGIIVDRRSSVDKVKEAALILGWDGVKDDKGRKFLSDLKDLSTKEYEGPMQYMMGELEGLNRDDYPVSIMFFHIREPQEIAKFLEQIPGSISILIKRDTGHEWNNHADQNVENHPYSYEVDNNGSLGDLFEKAQSFFEFLKSGWHYAKVS